MPCNTHANDSQTTSSLDYIGLHDHIVMPLGAVYCCTAVSYQYCIYQVRIIWNTKRMVSFAALVPSIPGMTDCSFPRRSSGT